MWNEVLIEILFLAFLGLLYYFYQKKKINNTEILALEFWHNLLEESKKLNEKSPQIDLEEFIADLNDHLISNDPIPTESWVSKWHQRDLPLKIKSKLI
jgi:hypothetical protein